MRCPGNNSRSFRASLRRKGTREGIEGKLTEKIDLTVDVNKDIVQRLMAARKRVAQGNREPASQVSREQYHVLGVSKGLVGMYFSEMSE